MQPIRTTCAYCGVGCGILATPVGERDVAIAGDPEHPANAGRLCSKGTHLGETVGLEGRLLHPMIGSRRASWDRALGLVASKLSRSIADYGPDSVAFYVSGQLLTEDYYVTNKLMKGFIGSANIDTNSRLCMASAVAGQVRAFGEDIVPASYADIDAADLVLLVGSNTAWCHPVVYQRLIAARAARGTKIVVIDPRRTETCEDADLHLALRPGSDIALFNGLLAYCRDHGMLDQDFLKRSVAVPDGFWGALAAGSDLWSVARDCDLALADVRRFFQLFAENKRTVTLFSQGINQSLRGTDQVNAILNLHLATGRIGKPGAAPFSITGQPNAMGGREVGALASTLAAHMDFAPANVERARRFWAAPRIATRPGAKAVDLFRGIKEGRIRAVWIMATNPAASMPDAGAVREALAGCPLVIVSDVIADTDTARLAHIRLPAAAWGEKDGTVTNSERMISRQRALFPLPGEARPDWWIVSEVGRRMGWRTAFAYDRAADIFREHARLSAYQNCGDRLFNLRDHVAIGNETYDQLVPFRWGGTGFADGVFSTADGKARLVPVNKPKPPTAVAAWPMTLNTGRYRDQWHTMTRTGLSPRLARHRGEPQIEIHPADAGALSIAEGDLVRVSTPQGNSLFRAALTDRQRRDEIFTPIHWTDCQSSAGRTALLTAPLTDPHSGQPGFKSTPARAEKVEVDWQAFLIARAMPRRIDALYHTRIRVAAGWLVELAGIGDPAPLAEGLLPKGERLDVLDPTRGGARYAVLADGRLEAALLVSKRGKLPSRDWLVAQLVTSATPSPTELLAGRPAKSDGDPGELVCACFDVGARTLLRAIAEQQLVSVEQVGQALRAGTNCGSCRPAIRSFLAAEKADAGRRLEASPGDRL